MPFSMLILRTKVPQSLFLLRQNLALVFPFLCTPADKENKFDHI
jgi:hypothetical protein